MANLLLVEDDASVRQIVMLQLSLVGYDVRAAEDAGQARRMMEEKTPDLAISGYHAARRGRLFAGRNDDGAGRSRIVFDGEDGGF